MTATRRFLMLLWIELKRCQGVLVAPIVAAGVIWFLRERALRDGVVLWRDVSLALAECGYVIGSVGAGYLVWVVDRNRRRHMSQQLAPLPVPGDRPFIVSTLAVLAWMTVSYALVAMYFGWIAFRDATWGGPDWSLMLVGLLTISVCIAIGAVVSILSRSPIVAPLTAILVFFANVYFSDTYNNSLAHRLVPIRFLSEVDYGLRVPLPSTLILTFVFWLFATGVTLALVAMLVRERTSLRVVGLVVSLLLVGVSVGRVSAEHSALTAPDGGWRTGSIAVEPVCQQGEIVEVCVHPAYESLLDEISTSADEVFRPLAGLDGVPDRLIDADLGPGDLTGTRSTYLSFGDRESIGVALGLTLPLVIDPGFEQTGVWGASQCVVVDSLVPDDFEHHCVFGSVTGHPADGTFTNDIHDPDLQARMRAKIASFRALGPDEQRAWLVTNWDALRAGEVALEEMP
jgi:hypothetical protein